MHPFRAHRHIKEGKEIAVGFNIYGPLQGKHKEEFLLR
jgi:hypothetical protein